MTHFHDQSLSTWLKQISSISPKEITLGLERVKEIAKRLHFVSPTVPVLLVGGTNGKGSCVAVLEKIYSVQGYRTGVFTSPILLRHNEMVRIQGKEVEDHYFCDAYAKIEESRKEIILTPFEYHTLAAFDIFNQHALDVWIIEVGLGGRLDAVNILDADVAIITSVSIDHVDWLGDTRELIGQEKAGIFRHNQPVVCGDSAPPDSLLTQAKKLNTPFYCQGKDFNYHIEKNTWTWKSKNTDYSNLPLSLLALQNISTSLMAVELLQSCLPVSASVIHQSIKNVSLPGRIEIQPGPVMHVMDVSHNPAAVALLARQIRLLSCTGKIRAVFSMLADKDIAGSLHQIKDLIKEWYAAPLLVKRGARVEQLRAAFQQEKIMAVQFYPSVMDSYAIACRHSKEGDCIVIFGSFHMVAEVKRSVEKTSS